MAHHIRLRRLPRKKLSELSVPGVYLLYKAGEVVYVGQSKDVYDRIRQHAWPAGTRHTYRGGFDEYAVTRVEDPVERTAVEQAYIAHHRPVGNHPEGNRRAFREQIELRKSAPELHSEKMAKDLKEILNY
jgi:hypothetical protein